MSDFHLHQLIQQIGGLPGWVGDNEGDTTQHQLGATLAKALQLAQVIDVDRLIGFEGGLHGFVEALGGGFGLGEFGIDFGDGHFADGLLVLLFGFLLVGHFGDLLSVAPTGNMPNR